jgi:hypothetical protein
MIETMPRAVREVFDGFEPLVRSDLLQCRDLIFEVAANLEAVGPITETLKWGQPSYLTEATGAGSTLRLASYGDVHKFAEASGAALFVHCATDLVEQFQSFYPKCFAYKGKRALVITDGVGPVREELRHCVGLALTYKIRKRSGRNSVVWAPETQKNP